MIPVAVVVAALLTAIIFRDDLMKKEMDVASVEKDIREHLAIGSSRAEVSSFLDQRKIEHSHIGDIAALPENRCTEMAMIRGASHKGVVRKDIQVLFKFDNADSKLVRFTVREIFTGP